MSTRAGRSDLLARELSRQLHALPATRYEFAVFDGRMTRRVWRARQAMRSLGWLKYKNARGCHVYLRPATTACVLVEGVTAEALAAMDADGLAPALVVEAAPERIETWFRLGIELGPKLGLCVGQVLAARYGGDPAAVDIRRLGRAAGFANRTADLAGTDGRYPSVRVVEARGRVTPGTEELVAQGEERLRRKTRRRAERTAERLDGANRKPPRDSPEAFLAREMARMARRYGAEMDPTRSEAVAARRMALSGYAKDEVAAALAACPEVAMRHPGGAGDYAARSAAWACGEARRRAR